MGQLESRACTFCAHVGAARVCGSVCVARLVPVPVVLVSSVSAFGEGPTTLWGWEKLQRGGRILLGWEMQLETRPERGTEECQEAAPSARLEVSGLASSPRTERLGWRKSQHAA